MTDNTLTTRGLRLSARPDGPLLPRHIESRPVSLPLSPRLLLRPRYISVDPYMRTRMHAEGYGYIERWQATSALSGWALAEVLHSREVGFTPGDLVVGHLPMQELVASEASGLIRVSSGIDPLAYLHPLGMTGFTAWVGMEHLGAPMPDDTVLVNAAAGAVGSLAAQLARRRGARVIVTAGRPDKRAWLARLGFDTVLDHRHPDYAAQLLDAATEGVTLGFENVGGAAFHATIEAMRRHGRIVLCGLVSQYQSTNPRQGPANIATLAANRVKVTPFVVPHYLKHWETFQRFMAPQVMKRTLDWRLDIMTGGLDSVAAALIGVLEGDNLGKRVVLME
ncbi:NADP-dependent oxidoreductase [Halomonas sp. 707D4]|nr:MULTISPECIES: NADP-dependent oxidoreductase [unclassified Halomonas]MCP1314871.1 NADP-dependent oxidoreductase [Halomonas sp. 707D7]MCP1325851.1 NADP-dependent oxidoreductase [Halomonas sp. 707D4]